MTDGFVVVVWFCGCGLVLWLWFLRKIRPRVVAKNIQELRESRTFWFCLGICDVCSETKGSQYFAAEGRQITPHITMFWTFDLQLYLYQNISDT